jgi:hypothetical protein
MLKFIENLFNVGGKDNIELPKNCPKYLRIYVNTVFRCEDCDKCENVHRLQYLHDEILSSVETYLTTYQQDEIVSCLAIVIEHAISKYPDVKPMDNKILMDIYDLIYKLETDKKHRRILILSPLFLKIFQHNTKTTNWYENEQIFPTIEALAAFFEIQESRLCTYSNETKPRHPMYVEEARNVIRSLFELACKRIDTKDEKYISSCLCIAFYLCVICTDVHVRVQPHTFFTELQVIAEKKQPLIDSLTKSNKEYFYVTKDVLFLLRMYANVK